MEGWVRLYFWWIFSLVIAARVILVVAKKKRFSCGSFFWLFLLEQMRILVRKQIMRRKWKGEWVCIFGDLICPLLAFTSGQEGIFRTFAISLLLPSVADAARRCKAEKPRRPAGKVRVHFVWIFSHPLIEAPVILVVAKKKSLSFCTFFLLFLFEQMQRLVGK